jgi:hypothetical protein
MLKIIENCNTIWSVTNYISLNVTINMSGNKHPGQLRNSGGRQNDCYSPFLLET